MKENEKIRYLFDKTRELRINILTMIYKAKSGHTGGSLSIADVLAVLYFDELKIDPKKPEWKERDRLILSKGHCSPALYSVLAMRGFFEMEVLYTYRKIGSSLQGHPDMKNGHGVDATTGSLGQGLSIGAGMALGLKVDKISSRVFVILGDGEIQEGQVWEAAMFAAKYKLDNLIAIVDVNGLQVDGYCSDIMPMNPLKDKWKSFGWNVVEVSGHDIGQLLYVMKDISKVKNRPSCILANTVKGKGVSFMENVCEWHGKAPNKEEYEAAMIELSKIYYF